MYITHFIDSQQSIVTAKKRREKLATAILYLSTISASSLKISVFSNKPIAAFEEFTKPILARGYGAEIHNVVATVEEISENGNILNWLLTWVHKSQMKCDVESRRNSSNSFYLYIEDDALFTEANLKYFMDYLPAMKELGLIPGFIRSEWSHIHECWTHPDSFEKAKFEDDFSNYPFDPRFKLAQFANPYSASILLDQPLAEEYFASESSIQQLACFKHPIIFDIGSTAALGLICENVPQGYKHRTAVICNANNLYPIPGSIIRHMDDRYGNDVWQAHFRLFDDRNSTPLRTKRSIWDYLKRLQKPDRFVLLSRFIKELMTRIRTDRN